MARKRQVPEEPLKGDMTPMIDVVFQLLIFFMLSIEFKELEGKLSAYLPKDVGVNQSEATPIEKLEIRLKVLKEGTKLMPRGDELWKGEGAYRYGNDREVQYAVGPRVVRDLAELRQRLKAQIQAEPKQPVTIDAYPPAVYADVTRVLDEVIEAGYIDVTFVGARDVKPTTQQ